MSIQDTYESKAAGQLIGAALVHGDCLYSDCYQSRSVQYSSEERRPPKANRVGYCN